jgi:hypothetical protein
MRPTRAQQLWSGVLAIPTRIVGSLEEAWPAVDSNLIRDSIKNALQLRHRNGAGAHDLKWCLTFEPDFERSPWLEEVAVPLHVDVLMETRIVECITIRPHWPGSKVSRGYTVPGCTADIGSSDLHPEVVAQLDARGGGDLSLRVTPSDECVYGEWGTRVRWNGTLVIDVNSMELDR